MALGKTLTVYLAADLRKFNTGLTQAQTGIRGFAASMTNFLGPAALGAGLAIAGLATKMAVDGVQAALDEEESMRKLALTMDNLNLAHDTKQVEAYIYQLERSLGVADTELRPAYDRLVRSIGDTENAQDKLRLALDISAGTGKSLSTVVEALGKAYDGNTTGLSRLGAGIDATILRTGNMQAITQTLAATFSGQASEAADTMRGRAQVLKTAIDNLAEAFGTGLLSGLQDATGGVEDTVKAMEEMEDEAATVGKAVALLGTEALDLGAGFVDAYGGLMTFIRGLQGSGNIFQKALGFLNPFGPVAVLLGDGFTAVGEAGDDAAAGTDAAGNAAEGAIPKYDKLRGSVQLTTEAYGRYIAATSAARGAIQDANRDYKDLAARQQVVNTFTYDYVDASNAAGGATSRTDTATNKLTQTYNELNGEITGIKNVVAAQTAELNKATEAILDYANTIQQDILSNIDLGKVYEGQFDEEGKKTGKSLIAGFNDQINQAEWFGNVLNAIKAQGADQSLIEHISSLGPATGGALAQQMLDEGLVPELNKKWVNVQSTTKNLAMGLVPEGLIAGQDMAANMLKGTITILDEGRQTMKMLGKNVGKNVGAAFKTQFLADIAAAVSEVEAIQTAARAERVAAATARAQVITEQQVAQAMANLLRQSDARLGVNNQPVLA